MASPRLALMRSLIAQALRVSYLQTLQFGTERQVLTNGKTRPTEHTHPSQMPAKTRRTSRQRMITFIGIRNKKNRLSELTPRLGVIYT